MQMGRKCSPSPCVVLDRYHAPNESLADPEGQKGRGQRHVVSGSLKRAVRRGYKPGISLVAPLVAMMLLLASLESPSLVNEQVAGWT